ncbi:MAG: VOC family protein [Pseudomonadota bacterium]
MPAPFVWFDNMTAQPQGATQFLHAMFGWQPRDIGAMTFLTEDGQDMPFAATCKALNGITGWVPYIEVDDLPAATARALEHGATVIAENVKGPAGDASFVRDPGGSAMALWKRDQGA